MGGVEFIPYSEAKIKQWRLKLEEEKKLAEQKNAKKGKGKNDKGPEE